MEEAILMATIEVEIMEETYDAGLVEGQVRGLTVNYVPIQDMVLGSAIDGLIKDSKEALLFLQQMMKLSNMEEKCQECLREEKDDEDCQKIIVGVPWSFDNALVALEILFGKGRMENMSFKYADICVQIHQNPLLCMTKDIGMFLGGMIGAVVDVDEGEAGDCAGKFMRVKVKIEIDKPLRRCLRGHFG
ncbi:hypothetical protein Ddye_020408 [Dipteronia dyeriana]|uniref:Uncharacterized protein n=1 Tax=Dipteronia dyeriana TaxID=168575 RepID=A0AAD9WWJ6_9ROSI|nr:hypothetical protein Ddye_020408 [Dipteronia dyeriana]